MNLELFKGSGYQGLGVRGQGPGVSPAFGGIRGQRTEIRGQASGYIQINA
ncbi:MAG: hypothetical protein JXA79_01415 [Deltaproteobacteria bacterium]|nr:hypothetical protein [Deltaproteobacteria bacterium]